MKQIAQNYKTGELTQVEVPAPLCRAGGVLVRTGFSLVSAGTEMMKVRESKMSLVSKARARPDQVKKVMQSVAQNGLATTYAKAMNRLDSYTPLGYSICGEVIEIGDGVEGIALGQRVACGGDKYAHHAEFNWVPANLCAVVPDEVAPQHAAFTTVGAIAMQGVRQADIHLGETACVIGLGLIGQLLVQLLQANGVTVFGVDISRQRGELAEHLGAVATGVPGTPTLDVVKSEILRVTGGAGADCIFLAAGGQSNQPVELAAKLARDRARIVDIGKCKLDLPWKEYYGKELDIRFSRSYGPGRYDPSYEEEGNDYPIGYVRWTERRNMQCFLDLVRTHRLNLDALVTEVVPFDEAVSTYDRINKGDLKGLGFLFRYAADAVPRRRSLHLSSHATGTYVSGSGKTSQLRLGVIGCGNYGSSMLLPHLVRRQDVRLVEVATATSLSAANAQRKFGFESVSTDYQSILADESIDAVLVLTRHSSHAQMVCESLRCGKAVFVEKPLAVNRDQLEDICRTLDQTPQARLMVGYNRRFAPLLTQLKSAWGPVQGPLVVRYCVNAGQLDTDSWYAERATEGARFVGEGCHFVDTVSWWLGQQPTHVSTACTGDDPDNLLVTLIYSDGSLAQVSYLTQGQSKYPKETLEIFGQGKVARLINFRRAEMWRRSSCQKLRGGLKANKGQKQQMTAFVEALKQGGPLPIDLNSLVTTTAATFAAIRSAKSNRIEPVAIFDDCASDEQTGAPHNGEGKARANSARDSNLSRNLRPNKTILQ